MDFRRFLECPFGGFRVQGTQNRFSCRPTEIGQEKKPININIFGGTVSGTNRNRPWDKWDPSPRDKMGPVPGTNRPFSVDFHSKSAILSRLSLGRVGVRPWDDCPTRAVRKMFMCFLFIGFFCSHESRTHKPLNRLVRTLSHSHKVLGRPVRGFPYTA